MPAHASANASRGFDALVMERPMATCVTPLSRAMAGVATRTWSLPAAPKLDSRCHDEHACAKAFGEASGFLGGRNDTVASTPHCELRKKVNLLLDGRGKPNFR